MKTSPLDRHYAQVARVAREAHHAMMSGEFDPIHLWFRVGRLEAATASPGEGWALAFPEALPCNLTVEQLINWVHQRSGRIPYFPPE